MNYLRETLRQWAGYSSAVRWFLFGDMLWGFYTGVTMLLTNLHLLQLGHDERTIGMLQATLQVAMAALAIPVGLLADRLGRKPIMVAGTYLIAGAALMLPWVSSLPALYLLFALTGAGMGLSFSTEFPILAAEVPASQRGSLFSLVFVNFFAFNSLATLLGGKLARWLPAGPLSVYQWPLAIAGAACLLAGLARQQMRLSPVQEEPAPAAPGQGLRLHPAVMPLSLMSFLVGGWASLGWHFGNVILKGRFGLDDGLIAAILTGIGIAGAAGNLLGPALERRVGQVRLILALLVLVAPLQLASGAAVTLWPFILAFGLRHLAQSVQVPQTNAWSLTVVPDRNRSAMSSFNMVGFTLGLSLGDAVYGDLLARSAYGTSFTVAAGFAAASALVFWWLAARGKVAGPEAPATAPAG